MSNKSFIVIETKNGAASPNRVWSALSEQDYITRVEASNPRSDAGFENFEQVIRDDQERHAMQVTIMDKKEFDSWVADDLQHKVLAEAEKLGWYTKPEEHDE